MRRPTTPKQSGSEVLPSADSQPSNTQSPEMRSAETVGQNDATVNNENSPVEPSQAKRSKVKKPPKQLAQLWENDKSVWSFRSKDSVVKALEGAGFTKDDAKALFYCVGKLGHFEKKQKKILALICALNPSENGSSNQIKDNVMVILEKKYIISRLEILYALYNYPLVFQILKAKQQLFCKFSVSPFKH